MNKIKVFVEVWSIRAGGGPSGYVYNLLEGLNKLEMIEKSTIDITTIAKYENTRLNALSENTTKSAYIKISLIIHKIIPINFHQLFSCLFKRVRLKRTIKWKTIIKNDIVVFHGFQDPLLIEEAKKVTKTIYMPHCPTIAADELKMNNKLLGKKFSQKKYRKAIEAEKKMINAANYIVFPSIGASEEYYKYYNKELNNNNVIYIPSGIDLPIHALDGNYPLYQNQLQGCVLFAGRYVDHKGYDLFCDAAEYVSKKNRDIVFVSIGGGVKSNSKYVKDLGWKDNPYEYIKAASVIVIPNRYAYYDLLPLECAAMGKPLVMTTVGGNKDQLKELPDTIGCEAKIEALSKSIILAFEKAKINPNWGEGNKLKYQEYFNSVSLAKRWMDLFQKIKNEDI